MCEREREREKVSSQQVQLTYLLLYVHHTIVTFFALTHQWWVWLALPYSTCRTVMIQYHRIWNRMREERERNTPTWYNTCSLGGRKING